MSDRVLNAPLSMAVFFNLGFCKQIEFSETSQKCTKKRLINLINTKTYYKEYISLQYANLSLIWRHFNKILHIINFIDFLVELGRFRCHESLKYYPAYIYCSKSTIETLEKSAKYVQS